MEEEVNAITFYGTTFTMASRQYRSPRFHTLPFSREVHTRISRETWFHIPSGLAHRRSARPHRAKMGVNTSVSGPSHLARLVACCGYLCAVNGI